MKEDERMENEGDKILGAWGLKIMGAIIKIRFQKEEENKFGGKLLDVKVPERLKPLIERKLKRTKGNNLEDIYSSNLFCLTYNPSKKIYELGEINSSFLDRDNIPSVYRGLKSKFEAEVISSNTLVLRTKVFGFNRQMVLTKEKY
ncbi:MAG TPA: hypothetical protein VKK79_24880 [Candidatus Lokiarchaeia archaeon]|nr:hypothetical protein [Candidatus Lokiarchaeia archaeon]